MVSVSSVEKQKSPNATTRRVVISSLILAPITGAFAGTVGFIRRSARALRPSSRGRSSNCCANCGLVGHSMLSCPSNPKVF